MFFVACGSDKNPDVQKVLDSNDISQVKELKKNLEKQERILSEKIEKLDEKIKELSPKAKQILVSVKKLKNETFNHYVELQGSVLTKKNILVYPQAPGQLQSIFVKKGSRVAKGQLLAKIDDNGLSNQLAQLQIQADLAKTTYERQANLWKQKIGSEIQFLQAKANYEAQTNAVKMMKANIERYAVRAPFSGVIDDIFKETGALVNPGMGGEIFRVVNLRNMYIEADVPESYLPKIKKGEDVVVNFTVLNKEINSKISQVGSHINPMNRTFKVEIKTPNLKGMIKPNMTAKLKINDYKNNNALLISQSAISENGKGEKYVFIITNRSGKKGTVKKVFIETGMTKNGIIEVTKGLTEGNELITEGITAIKEGQEVTVLSE